MALCGERLDARRAQDRDAVRALKAEDRSTLAPTRGPAPCCARRKSTDRLRPRSARAEARARAPWSADPAAPRTCRCTGSSCSACSGGSRDALERCERASPSLETFAPPGSYRADFWMLHGLCCAALAEEAQRSAAPRARSGALHARLRELLALASLSAGRRAHGAAARRRAARGCTARRRSRCAATSRRRSAPHERGYRHHAALCHERRASLLQRLRRKTEAAAALKQALQHYRDWGASAKVARARGRGGSEPAEPRRSRLGMALAKLRSERNQQKTAEPDAKRPLADAKRPLE